MIVAKNKLFQILKTKGFIKACFFLGKKTIVANAAESVANEIFNIPESDLEKIFSGNPCRRTKSVKKNKKRKTQDSLSLKNSKKIKVMDKWEQEMRNNLAKKEFENQALQQEVMKWYGEAKDAKHEAHVTKVIYGEKFIEETGKEASAELKENC